MELEGLVRALGFLTQNSIEAGTLVTDRHKQIAKYVREAHPNITHQYDVWHIAKGGQVKHTTCTSLSHASCGYRYQEEVSPYFNNKRLLHYW